MLLLMWCFEVIDIMKFLIEALDLSLCLVIINDVKILLKMDEY